MIRVARVLDQEYQGTWCIILLFSSRLTSGFLVTKYGFIHLYDLSVFKDHLNHGASFFKDGFIDLITVLRYYCPDIPVGEVRDKNEMMLIIWYQSPTLMMAVHNAHNCDFHSPGFLCMVQAIFFQVICMLATTMTFRISFSDLLFFTRNARKAPLIPEGFVLEKPLERKATSIQLKPESPTFPSALPTTSQSPVPLPASPTPETPLMPVFSIGNPSTETLVNVVSQPGSPTPILQLYPPANEAVQTRRISFADCATPSRSVKPVNVIDVGQVSYKPSAAAAETHEQAKAFREDVPDMEKKSKRKSIMRSTKAHRFSVPVFSSLTHLTNKRASLLRISAAVLDSLLIMAAYPEAVGTINRGDRRRSESGDLCRTA
ncbi:uncharacterized protein EDB93DRAFT_1108068 [Suillus bovinus]|uniref:uncharacterized protein n=1 Tax=Suillus bovinus TaxID=48563 RepID=UPI001B8612B9|nr:uncharacterized protein EDB93DRAFT_1108068 [Suillus bovinus]KAG2131603.1 hypothetical protein EDB93DRAFT_1108068 [Suillus bovinus]